MSAASLQRRGSPRPYRNLFMWMGRPELLKPARGGALEYSIARLFGCNKTILGDARQAVNPGGASTAADIQRAFPRSTAVALHKSYRSTWEINAFVQRILPNPDLVAIRRHGPLPLVMACRGAREEVARVCDVIREFEASPHRTIAVICKTDAQASKLHRALEDAGISASRLTREGTWTGRGTMVCTAHLAKGLEFDRVIVPGVSSAHYRSELDRHLLYVACTRAMHHLTLTHTGPVTALLDAPTPAGA